MAEEQAAEGLPAPIIIKRIKKGGHGHHGGAWKVAYADFVTAMMAFFLLLWLINVTTPDQKKGLAEYFTPTIGIKDSMGIGFKGGKKPEPEGRSKNDLTRPGIVVGQPQQQGPVASAAENPSIPDPNSESTSSAKNGKEDKTKQNSEEKDTQDNDQFKITTEEIRQSLEQDPDIKDYRNNVIVDTSQEGMKIDMIDDEKKPMFIPGTATLTDQGKKVLDSMSSIIIKTPNSMVIKGHTDASGVTANPQYTNWELSADRANAARRFLVTTPLEPARITKVEGLADRDLLTPDQPASPRNRRVTIVLLRSSYFRDPKAVPNTRAIISVPDPKVKKPEPKEEAPPEEKKPPGTPLFDPGAASDQPPKVEAPKASDAEANPELHLPTPKPVSEMKKAEPPKEKAPASSKKAGLPDGSIFNPATVQPAKPQAPEAPAAEAKPVLQLPDPKPQSEVKKAAPVQDKAKSDNASDQIPAKVLQPEGDDVPAELRKPADTTR